VGFYGRPDRVGDAVARMTAPLLLLQAGDDAHIPADAVDGLVAAAPVRAEKHVFEGCPHSFFDRTAPQHAAACDHAWDLVRAFVARCT
jgi:carboxymethylenebutenolidase